jgi:hypothetical protein
MTVLLRDGRGKLAILQVQKTAWIPGIESKVRHVVHAENNASMHCQKELSENNLPSIRHFINRDLLQLESTFFDDFGAKRLLRPIIDRQIDNIR